MSIPGSSVGRAQDSYMTKIHLVVKGSSPFLGVCFFGSFASGMLIVALAIFRLQTGCSRVEQMAAIR